MIIKDVHISGFGQLYNRDFAFEPGINLICGHNESGKSTLYSFIFHMLYGISRGRGRASRSDAYTKYCPWDYPDSFGGSMRIIADDNTSYLIERCFNTSAKTLIITNEQTGEKVSNDEEYLKNLIGGISENAFNCTLSISQLGVNAGEDMSELIKKNILNIGCTSSFNIDVPNAIKLLNDRKKELTASLNHDVRKQYYETIESIDEINLTLDKKRSEIAQLPAYTQNQAAELEQQNTALNEETNRLIADYEQLKKELELEGFKNLSDIITLESVHNNLWTMVSEMDYLDNNSTPKDDIETEQIMDNEESLNSADIIKGSLFSLCMILALIFFACRLHSAGIVFLIISILLGLYTALPFLPEWLGGYPWFENTLGVPAKAIKKYRKKKRTVFTKEEPLYTNENLVKKLTNIYEKYIGKTGITEENRENLINYISNVKSRFQSLTRLKNSIEANKDKVSANRETLLTIKNSSLDNAKLFWETDNLQLQLDNLEEQKHKLSLVLEDNKKLKDEIEALDLAIGTIKEITLNMHTKYAPKLNKAVSDTFNKITQKNYGELLISENLNITLNDKNRTIPIEALSQGTIEQIYMALRLSTADILFGKAAFPLMLDEVFAMYDNQRLAQTLRYINSEHNGQTFLFSCQNREKLILEKLNIPFNYIKL